MPTVEFLRNSEGQWVAKLDGKTIETSMAGRVWPVTAGGYDTFIERLKAYCFDAGNGIVNCIEVFYAYHSCCDKLIGLPRGTVFTIEIKE